MYNQKEQNKKHKNALLTIFYYSYGLWPVIVIIVRLVALVLQNVMIYISQVHINLQILISCSECANLMFFFKKYVYNCLNGIIPNIWYS